MLARELLTISTLSWRNQMAKGRHKPKPQRKQKKKAKRRVKKTAGAVSGSY